MRFALLAIWWLFLLSLIAAIAYVLGTYLLLAYDRRLAKTGQVSPPYLNHTQFPRGRARWLAIGGEIAATLACIWLFPLGMIFRQPWKQAKNHTRPIVLIHGYHHNQSAWLWFRRKLKLAGLGPVYSYNLPQGVNDTAMLARHLAKFLENEEKLILIGHSMGGLVAAYYATNLAPPHQVSHLITIGTPLHGTRMAVMNFGTLARQMRPGSGFLRDLGWKIASDTTTSYRHITSQFDNIIFPYQSALFGDDLAKQFVLPATGHLSLLFQKKVSNQVIRWLQATATEHPSPQRKKPRRPYPLPA